jgi:DNA recombination protein RmuC
MTLDPASLTLGFLAGAVTAGLFMAFLHRSARDSFKAVSAEALNSNNQTFLALAEQYLGRLQEAAKGDLELRGQTIESTVAPVAKTLEALKLQIDEMEKARAGAYEGLRQHVTSMQETQLLLRQETGALVAAMRTPMGRGSWGENQLMRLFELVGMREGADFHSQMTVVGEDARIRPDIVVKLPGDKTIVIDAKAPLEAYFAAIEAVDEPTRQIKLKAHAGQVREQMRKLADKEYWKQFKHSPEFVVMFVPSESAFATAAQLDPELIEYGMKANVIIATPLTLFALLRTIAYGWRQERIAENAADIAKLGRELYERVAGLAGTYDKLGDSLKRSVEHYNTALGQIESRVLVTARKLKDRHDIAAAEIEAIEAVEATPRLLAAAELLAAKEAS